MRRPWINEKKILINEILKDTRCDVVIQKEPLSDLSAFDKGLGNLILQERDLNKTF